MILKAFGEQRVMVEAVMDPKGTGIDSGAWLVMSPMWSRDVTGPAEELDPGQTVAPRDLTFYVCLSSSFL